MADADKTLTRIAALLRKAEQTDNEHEAEAFLAAAQRISTAAQVDLEVARAHVANDARKPVLEQRRIAIGERGRMGLSTYVALFSSIAGPNGVTIDIAHNSTYVLAYGFDTDIDLVEALYTSLIVQMVTASDAYIRSGAHRAELVETYDYYNGRGQKPVSGRTARLSFQEAYASKIGSRLREAKREALASIDAEREAEAVALAAAADVQQAPAEVQGAELVLAGRSLAVQSFYKDKSTARGSYKGGSRRSSHSRTAAAAGRTAGSRARIGSEKAIGGSRTALGR